MKTIINNEGKEIQITNEFYNYLQSQYNDGVYSVVFFAEGTQCVILPNNFR